MASSGRRLEGRAGVAQEFQRNPAAPGRDRLLMTGTRADGTALQMAGVIVFGVAGGQFTWARWYLEPVQAGGPGADEAVRRYAGARDATAPGTGPAPGSGSVR